MTGNKKMGLWLLVALTNAQIARNCSEKAQLELFVDFLRIFAILQRISTSFSILTGSAARSSSNKRRRRARARAQGARTVKSPLLRPVW